MNEAASTAGANEGAEQEGRLPVPARYEPPTLISPGEFGETTLGHGNVYSDDGTYMF